MSDVKIQPTATNPMSGLQGMSGINSCIFGSPKVQMEMIPVLEGNKPKMMVTTGAVTIMNYTDSKSGKKGEFHHTLGFVVVEISDKETFFHPIIHLTEHCPPPPLCDPVQLCAMLECNLLLTCHVSCVIFFDEHVAQLRKGWL
jgi:hypothetical protein